MTARDPNPAPLTFEHAQQLETLLKTLSPDEALWISGYLAGIARRPGAAPAVAAAPPASTAPARQLTILYGSETGRSESLAEDMAALATARGMAARAVDMADFRLQELRDVRDLVVITSTYGEGEPPGPATTFYEFLHSAKAPRLAETRFAVLGLGDSSYENFCQTAKDFDQRLETLGATRLHPRADCDVDFQVPAVQWIEAVLATFATEMQATAPPATPAISMPALQSMPARHGQHDPFPAPVVAMLNLNGRGSGKETLHVELSLEGSGLTYAPGDALGVVAKNDPALAEELLARLALPPEASVPDETGEMPLAEALVCTYEITTLTPRFLEQYAQLTGSAELLARVAPENRADLRAWTAGRQIVDVIAEFPAPGIDATTFVGMLRKLQPRLYSIASSKAAFPDEAHLTVAVVRYESHGRQRQGTASSWLARQHDGADKVPVFIESNKNFKLPADNAAPIIMIGAGTGVAPFRAFMQEREAIGAPGKNWLFFGDRHFRTDFLYQLEWQRLLKDGRLTRMDVAFSRDQEEKIYVQHRLLERGKEIYAWIEAGATIYVCGDASRLAPDIHAALSAILQLEGGMDAETAEATLKRLQQEKRYQRDVY